LIITHIGCYIKILFSINHPAHVHFFRNTIKALNEKHIKCLIVARDKDITLSLLDKYSIDYVVGSKAAKSLISKCCEIIEYQRVVYGILRREKPDTVMSIGGLLCIHAAKLCGTPYILFSDTEHARSEILISFPFAKFIVTPSCYLKNHGKKQVRYDGCHELAYLHPNRFTPNPTVLSDLGLNEVDKFFILRFVSWDAGHDMYQHGFTVNGKRRMVELLSKYGRVIISSEAQLPEEFETYRMPICPTKMHDLLYYATMYIGEGGTMASEAAVLGTPAIFVNTLRLGYLNEQESKYGLVYSCSDEESAHSKAAEWLAIPDIKAKWQAKRKKMLADKIDVTQFLLDVINAV